MTYLLDTNAWIRLFQFPDKIKASVRQNLNSEETSGLSPFSFIEVAQKNSKSPEKLGLTVDLAHWFDIAFPKNRMRLLPVTPQISAKAYDLGPDFHGDPADRIITATAMVNGLTLVTSDRKILDCSLLTTLSTF